MRKVIHHLRRQSEETRRHILHVLTVVSAIALGMLWVASLGGHFSDKDTQTQIKNDLSPLSVIKDNTVDGYRSITGGQPASTILSE